MTPSSIIIISIMFCALIFMTSLLHYTERQLKLTMECIKFNEFQIKNLQDLLEIRELQLKTANACFKNATERSNKYFELLKEYIKSKI